ncbi:hypothetical protein EDB84DRAFT_1570384 [Lactarius hengduanensis]|nr:hypothetical protein EDB84DRAFT_1570384 [Lactarius hengduanensis]
MLISSAAPKKRSLGATNGLTQMVVSIQRMKKSAMSQAPKRDTEVPLPLRTLLTRPVLISASSFAMLALLDMAPMVLISLVWAMGDAGRVRRA